MTGFPWTLPFLSFRLRRPGSPRPAAPPPTDPRDGLRRRGPPTRFREEPAAGRIETLTGPLDLLTGKSVLLLADVENLSISAKRLGRLLCYDTLRRRLQAHADRLESHAFFTRQDDDTEMAVAFTRIGWTAHPRNREVARTAQGLQVFANSDHTLCFGAGLLLGRGQYDVVMVASGDGALGCDLAHCIRRHAPTSTEVMTLSLAGSTSHRLDAARNPMISANIEIGADCLAARDPRTSAGFWADPVAVGGCDEGYRHVPAA